MQVSEVFGWAAVKMHILLLSYQLLAVFYQVSTSSQMFLFKINLEKLKNPHKSGFM